MIFTSIWMAKIKQSYFPHDRLDIDQKYSNLWWYCHIGIDSHAQKQNYSSRIYTKEAITNVYKEQCPSLVKATMVITTKTKTWTQQSTLGRRMDSYLFTQRYIIYSSQNRLMQHKLVSSYKYNIELKVLSITISNNMIAIRKTYCYYQCSR